MGVNCSYIFANVASRSSLTGELISVFLLYNLVPVAIKGFGYRINKFLISSGKQWITLLELFKSLIRVVNC